MHSMPYEERAIPVGHAVHAAPPGIDSQASGTDSQSSAPGEEIVPVKEPAVAPVTVFFKRVRAKLPVAPANRPVPPVMLMCSTMVSVVGAVGVACPREAPNTVSPLAAV